MNEQNRPSKQFLIRGGIATGIVAIVLIVQTDWFRALFNKPPLPPVVSTKTVGEFIAADTNANGISDWEEKLWGLDPTVLYTDGVPNKTIIEQKKLALGVSSDTEPANETDALARELFTIATALGQSGEITNESLAAVGTRLAESVEFGDMVNHYSLKDIHTVPTTSESLSVYYDRFSSLAATHAEANSEIDILVQALETGDTSGLESFSTIKNDYTQYAKELAALPVPIGAQKMHLDITNGIYNLSLAVQYMSEFSDNGANALAGVVLYKISDAHIVLASQDLHSYFAKYGILDEQT